MTDRFESKLPKRPFLGVCLAGDALLLGLAWLIFTHSPTPMGRWEILAYVACVGLGACLMITPFLMEYHSTMRVVEAERLKTAVLQIQNLEIIGRQITNATANWQSAHELSTKNVESARQLGAAVTSGARAFSEFIHKANDSEKNHLRLEVEKLKRGEGEWLQVLVHIMDHIYAVYYAAGRSSHPGLLDQITSFQNACRDVARRVGLVPFVSAPGEAFNPKAHQLADTQTAPEGARVGETIATGYTYQGKLLRPALVTLGTDPLYGKTDTTHLSVSKINKRRGQIQADEEVIVRVGDPSPDGETDEAPEAVEGLDQPASPDPDDGSLLR